MPVVVARADGTGVGVCHAGWRGLLGGVVEHTVERLGEGDLVAAVGPCAGPDAYEVGADVAEPLRAQFGPAALRGPNADLEPAPGSRWNAPASARSTWPGSAPSPMPSASSRTVATATPAAARP